MDLQYEIGLLENAFDFLASSIKTTSYMEDKYYLKYGILHLTSGIELIFKAILIEKDWKLVFSNVSKADYSKFVEGDFSSVNFKDCIERLENECGIEFKFEEKELLKVLREKRNRMEHFSIIDSIEALKSMQYQVINFMLDFISSNFVISNLNAEEDSLLEELRASLTSLNDFIEHRMDYINIELSYMSQYNTPLICPCCLQEALVTDAGTKCLFCGYADDSDKIATRYLEDIRRVYEYPIVKDGGEYPQYSCFECGSDSLIHDEEAEMWRCFACGIEYNEENINFCCTCGTPYVEDHDEGIGMCDNCIDYRINGKD